MVAFVENWLPCPSLEKITGYSKVVISFAVSYTWNPTKNQCSPSCAIGSPVPICSDQQGDEIQKWQEAGVTVLLSFGGAGMGGSWAGDVNDCWESCFDRVEDVVSQLQNIVQTQGFDGVDIDYEYHHTQRSSEFLKTLTTQLKSRMGANKIVSHAPMDGDVTEGRPYYELLQEVSSSVDFLLPQYYNGPFRPAQSLGPVLDHMGKIIDGIFGGDQSKVLFGFCIRDCSGTGSNVNSNDAVTIVQGIRARFPNYGGVFLWAASDDVGWSGPVSEALNAARLLSQGLARRLWFHV